ncbi:MAG TPA: hypothetical protein DDW52_12475 [Planctomycetaceae bacterium]|nr:hypothetical protein [Planctomycetaceae bacterium]
MSNTFEGAESNPPSRRKWLNIFLAGLALAAIVAVAFAFQSGAFSSAPEEELLTYEVRPSELKVSVTADGQLESANNIEIKCNVKGGSTVLWVIETGTSVKPGDVLVELDRSQIEDNITQRQISYENALANKIISASDVEVAKTSITEYLEGTFREEKSTIEKEIFDAEEAVKNARLELAAAQRLAARGIVRPLQLEGHNFAVESALKELELKNTRLESLEKYTKAKMLQELNATLSAAQARLAADEAALALETQRLEKEKEQLVNCTITAPASGLVIFPSMADWKSTPDIEEGAVVREQQTLLMIPDVDNMQVKVGIHESKVDRLSIGMPARVELQGSVMEGNVKEIAEVTKPAGWWTGNLVKYDTIIGLPSSSGLKPGMSAIVDVILAEYTDVLTVPVASVVEASGRHYCWVAEPDGAARRAVELGDTNDEFTIVTAGLTTGDRVVLNPTAFVEDAARTASVPSSDQEEPASASNSSTAGETASTQPRNRRGAKEAKLTSTKTKPETKTPTEKGKLAGNKRQAEHVAPGKAK